jgi:hypothetical protein
MRYATIFAATLALGLLFSGPTAAGPNVIEIGQERPVSGMVNKVDVDDGTIWVGPMRFSVPAGVFDLDELAEGNIVVVDYRKGDDGLVATRLRIDPLPR